MVELTSLDNIKSRQGWWPRKKCLQQLKYCFTNEVFKYSCNGKCKRGKPQKLSENFKTKMFRLQSSISMGRAADVFCGLLRWFESFFISNIPPNVFSNLIFYLCWSVPSPAPPSHFYQQSATFGEISTSPTSFAFQFMQLASLDNSMRIGKVSLSVFGTLFLQVAKKDN